MTSSQSTRSPLARLVLFVVCLSIAGTIIAGAHYYAVDLPRQSAVTAPENGLPPVQNCGCSERHLFCISNCDTVCSKDNPLGCFMCDQTCETNYYLCSLNCKTP